MGRANSCCSGISHEILDAEGFVRLFFIKNPRKWLTKEDVASYLQQNGKKLAPGSLYNVFYRLKRIDFLKSRRSSFAEYSLGEVSCENHRMGGVSLGHRCWRIDFFDYLGTLDWDRVQAVHDIHLWTPVIDSGFVDGSWKWHPHSKYFSKVVMEGGLRFELRANANVRTLSVIVTCGNDPVTYGYSGLVKLFSAISNVQARYVQGVQGAEDWIVREWHFGRDARGSLAGPDFALTFEDWFGDLVRVYKRHDGNIRAERVENPNVRVGELLGIRPSKADFRTDVGGKVRKNQSQYVCDLAVSSSNGIVDRTW